MKLKQIILLSLVFSFLWAGVDVGLTGGINSGTKQSSSYGAVLNYNLDEINTFGLDYQHYNYATKIDYDDYSVQDNLLTEINQYSIYYQRNYQFRSWFNPDPFAAYFKIGLVSMQVAKTKLDSSDLKDYYKAAGWPVSQYSAESDAAGAWFFGLGTSTMLDKNWQLGFEIRDTFFKYNIETEISGSGYDHKYNSDGNQMSLLSYIFTCMYRFPDPTDRNKLIEQQKVETTEGVLPVQKETTPPAALEQITTSDQKIFEEKTSSVNIKTGQNFNSQGLAVTLSSDRVKGGLEFMIFVQAQENIKVQKGSVLLPNLNKIELTAQGGNSFVATIKLPADYPAGTTKVKVYILKEDQNLLETTASVEVL